MEKYMLSIDQGTTSSRAMIFRNDGTCVASAQEPFEQHFPKPGWVEHDPEDLWNTVCDCIRQALAKANIQKGQIAGIGITNQRETTILWEKSTGRPVYNAIVWQCRRTAPLVEKMKESDPDFADKVLEKTGLVPDAYFSATKIQWILEEVPGLKARAGQGEILFGTVDSWILYRLTGGRSHATDYSNASRTMLFNIVTLSWDEELCRYFHIPMCMLPKALPGASEFGYVTTDIPGLEAIGGVGIYGILGDQPAALFGQTCFDKGDIKNTYGTGCFTLMNVGDSPLVSKRGLVTSAAWSFGGKTTYAMEGSVFNGGSTIQWLRDELKLIDHASDCDVLAETVPDNAGVYLVPAFSGLGAPYWDMYARGAILGLTRGTTKAHIARAALEGIAYQVYDLVNLMQEEAGCPITTLKVDGGASVSRFMMQFQADILNCSVDRAKERETTSQGVAYLAGLYCEYWKDIDELRKLRHCDTLFVAAMKEEERTRLIQNWKKAVSRAAAWEEKES
ncbi:MAG: glycerol kinase GlpK [Clostridiales bacterium]|nr:glycerol kinase GlpK [Clostridiales bacterium]